MNSYIAGLTQEQIDDIWNSCSEEEQKKVIEFAWRLLERYDK